MYFIHFSQLDMLVTEEFIGQVFGEFGTLNDVCIKKININKVCKFIRAAKTFSKIYFVTRRDQTLKTAMDSFITNVLTKVSNPHCKQFHGSIGE